MNCEKVKWGTLQFVSLSEQKLICIDGNHSPHCPHSLQYLFSGRCPMMKAICPPKLALLSRVSTHPVTIQYQNLCTLSQDTSEELSQPQSSPWGWSRALLKLHQSLTFLLSQFGFPYFPKGFVSKLFPKQISCKQFHNKNLFPGNSLWWHYLHHLQLYFWDNSIKIAFISKSYQAHRYPKLWVCGLCLDYVLNSSSLGEHVMTDGGEWPIAFTSNVPSPIIGFWAAQLSSKISELDLGILFKKDN